MMVTRPKIRDEAYVLTQLVMTSVGDAEPDLQLGQAWAELWRYQIPVGTSLMFQPGDVFSLYLEYLSDVVEHALLDDNGAYTDDTIDLNDADANDVALLPAVEVVNVDGFIFGQRYPFSRVRVVLGTAGVGAGSTIQWQYETAQDTWASIPGVVDGSAHWIGVDGTTYNISFPPPANWARTTHSGRYGYFVRALCTTANFTTTPLATSATINGGSMAVNGGERVRILIRDADGFNPRMLIAPYAQYRQLTNFDDQSLKYRLPITAPVVAREGEFLVIEGQPRGGIFDVSTGYFMLSGRRIRTGVYDQ